MFSTLSVMSHIDLVVRSLFRPSNILFELFESLKKNLLLDEFDAEETLDEDLDKLKTFLFLVLGNLAVAIDEYAEWFWYGEEKFVLLKRWRAESNVSDNEKFMGVVSKYVRVDKIPLSADVFDDDDDDDDDDVEEEEVEDEDDDEDDDDDDDEDDEEVVEDNDGYCEELIEEPNDEIFDSKYSRVRGISNLLFIDIE